MHSRIVQTANLFLLLVASGSALAAEPASDNPLWTWRLAHEQFREAGRLILERKYQQADDHLEKISQDLPPPYADISAKAREILQSAFQRPVVQESSEQDDDPFGPDVGVLDYSYIDDTLKGYYQLHLIAKACSHLQCYREAAELCIKAVRAHPDDHCGYRREASRYLLLSDADDVRFDELARISTHPEIRECQQSAREYREKRQQLNFSTPRRDGFWGLSDFQAALEQASDDPKRIEIYKLIAHELKSLKDIRGFEAWEEKRLQDFGHDATVRSEIYLARERRAREAGDDQAAKKWEAKLLVEFPKDHDLQVNLYESRGSDAFYAHDYETALANYQKIYTDYPKHARSESAMRDAAESLKKLARYDEALILLKKLAEIPGRPAVGLYGVPYTFRWSEVVAPLMSECCEALGDMPRAVKYARVNENQMFSSWCLNCGLFEKDQKKLQIARLLFAAGEAEEGLKVAEELLEGHGGFELQAAELFVRHFHDLGKLDELDRRVTKIERDNEAKILADYAEAGLPPPIEEMPSLGFVRDLAAIQRWRDRGDVDSLWQRLEELTGNSDCSAFYYYCRGADSPTSEADTDWQLKHVVTAFESLGKDARPVLLPKLRRHDRLQTWAMVLLAKQQSPEVLERIRYEFAADKERARYATAHPDEEEGEDVIESLRNDYLYALSFYKSKESRHLRESITRDGGDRWKSAAEDVSIGMSAHHEEEE